MKQRFASEIWKSGDPQLLKLFRLSKGQLYPNELARHSLLRRRHFYQRIVSGETTFRREVAHWLGKTASPARENISNETLDAFCRMHMGRCLNAEQREELKCIIFTLSEQSGVTIPDESHKVKVTPTSVNKTMRKLDLPYQIAFTDKQTWWLCWRDPIENTDTVSSN